VPSVASLERPYGHPSHFGRSPTCLALWFLHCAVAPAQQRASLTPPEVPAQTAEGPALWGPVLPLYHALRSVGLDPRRVYQVREAAIDREDVHIWLSDGTIAFTQAIDGHVTGAYLKVTARCWCAARSHGARFAGSLHQRRRAGGKSFLRILSLQ